MSLAIYLGPSIDGLLNSFLPIDNIPVSFIQLYSDQRPKIILEVSNKQLIWEIGSDVEFLWNTLQVFQVSCPIYNIFQLVLGSRTELVLDSIHQNSGFFQAFL